MNAELERLVILRDIAEKEMDNAIDLRNDMVTYKIARRRWNELRDNINNLRGLKPLIKKLKSSLRA
jgi:hypothetical protein